MTTGKHGPNHTGTRPGAAMAAEGESQIRRIYHLDRGYVRLEQKLNQLGAGIVRCKESAVEARA